MIKKLFALFLTLTAVTASAQVSVGDWTIYKPYNQVKIYDNNINNDQWFGHQMIETANKVYFVSAGSLYSYDPNTQESYSYDATNKLSDNKVLGIWYNFDKGYLVVGYETGNIDLIYDNGKVVNLPDIRDAILTESKKINYVSFEGDKAYVATDFGIVIFDIPRRCVVDSGIYNVRITSVAPMGDYIVAGTLYSPNAAIPGNQLRIIEKSKRINSWDNFRAVYNLWGNDIVPISPNMALHRSVSNAGYCLRLLTFNFANGSVAWRWAIDDTTPVDYIQPTGDGKWIVRGTNNGKLYTFSSDGNYTTTTLPSELAAQPITYYNDPTKVWTASADGIARFDISTDPPTVLNDYASPSKLNIPVVMDMRVQPSGNITMLQLAKSSNYDYDFTYQALKVGRITNGNFEDMTPKQLTHSSYGLNLWFDINGICEDPLNSDAYYLASFWEGLVRIEKKPNGEWEDVVCYNKPVFNNSNIAMVNNMGYRTSEAFVDQAGNLWVFNMLEDKDLSYYKPIYYLPASKRTQINTTPSDWKTITIPSFLPRFDSRAVVCKHPKNRNLVVFTGAGWGSPIVVYDHNGTESLDDDRYAVITRFVDQDGKNFDVRYLLALVEDNEGRIWCGTHTGILELTNPRDALAGDVTFNRLKVPRKDGSGFADYLLDAQSVFSIAVDGANNKWIGTMSGGLYYVSANGDEVIENFTTGNSPLMDNYIYSVVCDPNSSKIYLSTRYGLMSYNSQTSPAADDYSNVYAYPNPVRPGYTGWITITGLMDGSQVKIADTAGQVFYTTESQGGMVTWDGCNRDGQRVKSGVYYVFASRSGEGQSSQGAVCKILVVN